MKIIWIMPECPYPPNSGGRMAMWKKIEYLSKSNEIYLYSIIDNLEDEKHKQEMLQYCSEVNLYLRKKAISSLLKSIYYPYSAISRKNKKLKRDVEKACKEFVPDCIIVDFPQMMLNLSKKTISSQTVVLNQHNIEFETLYALSKSAHSKLKKIIFNFVGMQMRLYEKKLYAAKNISLYTFVSESDKIFFEKRYNCSNTYLVPIGTEQYESKNDLKSHNILFVGKMSYPPNIEAVKWFAENVFSELVKTIPDAKFYIVGKEPVAEVEELADKNSNIVVTGAVDSVQPYYDKCNLVIVPVFHGGGVNVKLLEALGIWKNCYYD